MTAATPAPRNLQQRKLAVMGRCHEIVPDKKHGKGFDYISVQAVSNHLRRFLVEEGLAVSSGIRDGEVRITLINADNPEDREDNFWPLVEDDKAWAYSVKFALIRLFLIGDGEEDDEALMADRSGKAAVRPVPTAPVAPTPTRTVAAVPAANPAPARPAGVRPPARAAVTVPRNGAGDDVPPPSDDDYPWSK